jgi:hypothetical protein
MTREWCFKHQLLRPAGEQCGQCATETDQAERRDALTILLGLVDDQGQQIASLIRQLNELKHVVLDLQRAHNDQVQP